MSKLLEQIKNTKEFTLGDVCVSSGGGTPSTAIQEYWNGDILWLTPAEISNADFTLISDTKRKITKKGKYEKLLRKRSLIYRQALGYGQILGLINFEPRLFQGGAQRTHPNLLLTN